MKSEVVLRHVSASHLLSEELRRERITKQRTDSEGRGDLIIGHILNIHNTGITEYIERLLTPCVNIIML